MVRPLVGNLVELGGGVWVECSPIDTEDLGSDPGVDRYFYLRLHINFLLQFLWHSPWTSGFTIFQSFLLQFASLFLCVQAVQILQMLSLSLFSVSLCWNPSFSFSASRVEGTTTKKLGRVKLLLIWNNLIIWRCEGVRSGILTLDLPTRGF